MKKQRKPLDVFHMQSSAHSIRRGSYLVYLVSEQNAEK